MRERLARLQHRAKRISQRRVGWQPTLVGDDREIPMCLDGRPAFRKHVGSGAPDVDAPDGHAATSRVVVPRGSRVAHLRHDSIPVDGKSTRAAGRNAEHAVQCDGVMAACLVRGSAADAVRGAIDDGVGRALYRLPHADDEPRSTCRTRSWTGSAALPGRTEGCAPPLGPHAGLLAWPRRTGCCSSSSW